ncbi:MAG TPA: ribosome biogenesis GTP-binding protein YihA/YsxC [Vicinamibacteria bacterium]|nr:ribosome biogenesis GTP-binding protein YihA/YsxC [Vicinamibacteria bacterium]
MSRTQTLQLVRSAASPPDFPEDDLPEVAAVGRSNVGKSSLLNRLVGLRKLAFVSKTPGRTQVVNFFRVSERLMLVDLPGYGFARAPVAVRRKWERLITSYLFERKKERLVLLLVDLRRDPLASDLGMRDRIEQAGLDYVVVATKADKLGRSRRRDQLAKLTGAFGAAGAIPVIPFSAVTSEGRKELWKVIERHVRGARRAPKK